MSPLGPFDGGRLGWGCRTAVAKALYGHGLIETNWEAGPADGLGAMVGAFALPCIAR